MNKHLKPGVAVDVRGASDEDVQAVIEVFVRAGAIRGIDDRITKFICWGSSTKKVYFFGGDSVGGYELITINQALGRESEVENKDFCGTEMQPIGWHGEVTYGSRAVFHECVILPDCKISLKLQSEWTVKDFNNWIGKGFEFRPLKTEKEKFVERFISDWTNCKSSIADFIADEYDKGLRFTE